MKVFEGFHSHGGSQLSSIDRWSVHESIQLPAMAPDEALAAANGGMFSLVSGFLLPHLIINYCYL